MHWLYFLLISSNSYTHLPQFDLSLVWRVPTLSTLHMLPQILSPVVSNTVAVKTPIKKMNINIWWNNERNLPAAVGFLVSILCVEESVKILQWKEYNWRVKIIIKLPWSRQNEISHFLHHGSSGGQGGLSGPFYWCDEVQHNPIQG